MRRHGAHCIPDAREARPEVRAAVLDGVVDDDVLHDGVADVPDGVDDGVGRGRDGAEVVREGEDGPVVGDGAEGGVLGVRERAVVDELCPDKDVLASLVRRACGLGGETSQYCNIGPRMGWYV